MKKLIGTIAAALVFIGLGFAGYSLIFGIPTGPKKLASALWAVEISGENRVIFTTVQNRSSVGGGRYSPRTVSNSFYHLVARRSLDGVTRAKANLGKDERSTVLGLAGGLIWLWRSKGNNFGLQAHHSETLELLLSREEIAKAYPTHAEMLPKDPKFVSVPANGDSVIIKKLDADILVLSVDDDELRPYLGDWADKSAGRQKQPTERPSRLVSGEIVRGLVGLSHGLPEGSELPGYLVEHYYADSFILEDYWYAFLNAKRLQELRQKINGGSLGLFQKSIAEFEREIKHFSKSLRQIFRKQRKAGRSAPFAKSPDVPKSGEPNKKDATRLYRMTIGFDKKRSRRVLKSVSSDGFESARYIRAGFLIWRGLNQKRTSVLVLDKPRPVIVLHKKTLAEDANWQLRRLSLEGKVVWQADTGLKIINHMVTSTEALIIAGLSVRGGPKKNPRFDMAHINTGTGAISLRSLDKDN